MEKITYTTLKIGTSCSPSAKPRVIERIHAYKVEVSCGGGMGGSHWVEYIIADDSTFLSEQINRVKNILGEDVILNTRFVVKATPIDVLIVEHDTTAYTNCRRKRCDESHSIYYVSIQPNRSYEITDLYYDWECLCNNKQLIESLSYMDGVRIR